MRIKNFTLMLLAVLFSTVGFAQKSFTVQKDLAYTRQTQVQTMVKQNSLPGFAKNQQSAPTKGCAAKARAKAAELVTPPEKGYLEYYTLTGTATYYTQSGSKTVNVSRQVKVVWDDEDEDIVYISGLSYYMPSAFVMGTFNKEGDQVTFAAGQFMGDGVYFGGYGDGSMVDVVADYNEKEGSFTFAKDYLLDNGDPKTLGFYAYFQPGVTLVPLEGDPEIPVEIPNDLEIETYAYTAINYFASNAAVSGNVNVGFSGTIGEGCDVYIQGMSNDYPEAWIKGTFTDETTVVFRSGQLLTDEDEVYFVSINDNYDIVDEYILLYDPETGIFEEGDYAPLISSSKTSLSVWQFYYGYIIKPITEKAATPANSLVTNMAYSPQADVLEFNLSKVDTDGEGLVADKLTYKLYYQDAEGTVVPVTFSKDDYTSLEEDLTEIPATLIDGKDFKDGELKLNMEHGPSWAQVGIQGIYYGGEERHESEIAWYTPIWPYTITLPEGLTVTEHTFIGETYDNDSDSDIPFERTVGLALDGNDIYISGLGTANEDVWVKGTKNSDGNYEFALGQSMGNYGTSYSLFLVGWVDRAAVDLVLAIDAANGVYEFQSDFLENAKYTDKSYYLNYFNAGATINIAEAGQEVYEPVTVPEDLVAETWTFSGTDYFDEVAVSRTVLVGFDGEDVYVQGLSETLPEAWVKGTLEDDQITFEKGQFLGYVTEEDASWFMGLNPSSAAILDYVVDYDAETFTMTGSDASNLLCVNAYKNKISKSVYELYENVKIKKLVEKATTPATPSITHMAFYPYGDAAEFNIPTLDVDGDGLVDTLLSYKLYYDEGDGEAKEVTFTTDLYECLEEDMTVIPYGFLDDVDEDGNPVGYDFEANRVYLNMDISSWTRVGIQSIYTGGGETNASEIGWYTIIMPTVTELPEGAEVSTYGFVGTRVQGSGTVDFTKDVRVAKVDNDVYIQGVGRLSTQTWIKGTKNPETGVYTFPKGQYLGYYPDEVEPSYCFLMGYSDMFGAIDVRMNYDEETGIFTTTTDLVENADYVDKLYYVTRISSGAQIIPGDSPDAITTIDANAEENGARFNIAGQRVGKSYKGLIVEKGRKLLKK